MKNQLNKFVSGSKDNTKVLIFNASFTGEDKSGNLLAPSALHRLIIECHAPIDGKMTKLEGNIPISEVPALISLSEQALHDNVIYQQNREFNLLTGTWKPKMSVKDENGNTFVYNMTVKYNGSMKIPVNITLSNAFCPVVRKDDGRMNIPSSQNINTKEVKLFVSAQEWYNQLSYAWESYCEFKTAMATRGAYDTAYGIETE